MIAAQFANPSTLGDLIYQVKQAFSKMGDATPILVGKAYLTTNKEGQTGIGNPPRVVFAPEALSGSGKIQPPQEMGKAASMVHSCIVYVRAKESGDDIDRWKAVYSLADRVIDCIQVAGTGRVEWLSLDSGSPIDSDGFGAELVFGFTYRRDIHHDAARWALPAADADDDAQKPHPPPGIPATSVTIDPVTTTPLPLS
jgi:hypothetical protein